MCWIRKILRWLFLFLGEFENLLERWFVFPRVLLFVLLHFLFCAEDAVYIGTHGLEFFVIILEIMVSIILGISIVRPQYNADRLRHERIKSSYAGVVCKTEKSEDGQ